MSAPIIAGSGICMEHRECTSCGRQMHVPHFTRSRQCLRCENAAAAAESARILALPTPAWAVPDDPFEGLDKPLRITGRNYSNAEVRSQL